MRGRDRLARCEKGLECVHASPVVGTATDGQATLAMGWEIPTKVVCEEGQTAHRYRFHVATGLRIAEEACSPPALDWTRGSLSLTGGLSHWLRVGGAQIWALLRAALGVER
mmetsp:Transcript_23126/g.70841  ORF Transcript_23126/g.70841 Transcript_23126/m.70841 type:complete len:111 (-) Transcript_23126:76-408(-)|eukprot:scaffold20527_cov24-Tisochrysis_lutea.AAC.2